MTKTYGVLMSGEMIRAYKDRLKTETRRTRGLDVVNKEPDDFRFIGFDQVRPYALFEHYSSGLVYFLRMPYGRIGDTLWFKETYAPMCNNADFGYCTCETDEEEKRNHYIEYRADTGNPYPGEWPEEEAKGNEDAPKWKPSMFMKREYSRFKDVSILDVAVQRLKDITGRQAFAEGYRNNVQIDELRDAAALSWYFELWDRLNGKKLPVKVNPWVWVYRFARYEGEKA